MAQTSTILIKLAGTPLVGAEVITTTDEEILTTDADGKIVAEFPDNYAELLMFAVRHASLGSSIYVAGCILEAGEDYELNMPIPANETGIYGTHTNFAAKL